MNYKKNESTSQDGISIKDLVESIKSKKTGYKKISLKNIKPRGHDLRQTRNPEQLKNSILQNGITEPLSVNEVDGYFRLINGKTRWCAMMLDGVADQYKKNFGSLDIYCETYKGLTEEEEDYLDAIKNAEQKSLSKEEKLKYVERYGDKINENDLRNILGLELKQVREYIVVAKVPEESRRRDATGDISIRDTMIVAEINVDPKLKPQIAKANLGSLDGGRTENELRILRNNINERVKNIPITKETPEFIVKHELDKSQASTLTTYAAIPKVPRGSQEKYDQFESVLKSVRPDEIIFANPEISEYYVDDDDKPIKTQIMRAYDWAKENSKMLIVTNKNKLECEEWNTKFPDMNIMNISIEKYLINNVTPSNKKTLLYLHLSGDRTTRDILSERTLKDLKKIRPKITILSIYVSGWYNDTGKEEELISRFGILEQKNAVIETLDQYLSEIEIQIDHVLKHKIVWEKFVGRAVSLVSWS